MIGEPTIPDRLVEGLLLEAFVAHIRSTLAEKAIAAIRPEIEEAARTAIAEMTPRIKSHFDLHADRLLINLLMGEPKVDGRMP